MLAIAALALLLSGCAHSRPAASAWSPVYDAAWSDVTACWQATPPRPAVVVREDCTPGENGVQRWNAGNALLGEVWLTGMTTGNVVTVCADLAALRHEFSEYVKKFVDGGPRYLNGSGKCWL